MVNFFIRIDRKGFKDIVGAETPYMTKLLASSRVHQHLGYDISEYERKLDGRCLYDFESKPTHRPANDA